MCGIVAYVGRKLAQPLLIEGLKRLEYRGYDSAGIAVIDESGGLHIRRAVGRISVLENTIVGKGKLPTAHIGMAHTRWATHGAPNEINAHPHTDDTGRIAPSKRRSSRLLRLKPVTDSDYFFSFSIPAMNSLTLVPPYPDLR